MAASTRGPQGLGPTFCLAVKKKCSPGEELTEAKVHGKKIRHMKTASVYLIQEKEAQWSDESE